MFSMFLEKVPFYYLEKIVLKRTNPKWCCGLIEDFHCGFLILSRILEEVFRSFLWSDAARMAGYEFRLNMHQFDTSKLPYVVACSNYMSISFKSPNSLKTKLIELKRIEEYLGIP